MGEERLFEADEAPEKYFGVSSNGRTAVSGTAYEGSIPSTPSEVLVVFSVVPEQPSQTNKLSTHSKRQTVSVKLAEDSGLPNNRCTGG